MRSALDYLVSTPRDPLNKRILGLYYGTVALAQAEMLASPSGPADLHAVEAMTRYGHGLFTLPPSHSGFADLHVGVQANGFFPQWMKFLGQDTSGYPATRPASLAELEKVPSGMASLLTDLFASIPEIEGLYTDVVGGSPRWILVAYDLEANARRPVGNSAVRTVDSTYGWFLDPSGKVSAESLESAGWPLAGRLRFCRNRISCARGSRRSPPLVEGASDPFIPIWKQPRTPVPDRGRPPRVPYHCRGHLVCTIHHGALQAERMATCRRKGPGSLYRPGASVDRGVGTAPSRTFPPEHSRRTRPHRATRQFLRLKPLAGRHHCAFANAWAASNSRRTRPCGWPPISCYGLPVKPKPLWAACVSNLGR